MSDQITEVYEKFKHLDMCLSDTEWCKSGEGSAIYGIAGEMWRAIKETKEHDISTLELIDGRIEGLRILFNTPEDKKTMTDKELLYAIEELKIIRACLTPDAPLGAEAHLK
jgi:hypothetical protein